MEYKMEDNYVNTSLKKIEALSQMIVAISGVYFPERATKDELIKKATAIIIQELNNII